MNQKRSKKGHEVEIIGLKGQVEGQEKSVIRIKEADGCIICIKQSKAQKRKTRSSDLPSTFYHSK